MSDSNLVETVKDDEFKDITIEVKLRFPIDHYNALEIEAKKHGMNLSDYIVAFLFNDVSKG